MLKKLIAAAALILGAPLLGIAAAPAAAQAKDAPIPCERACMEDLAGRFLDALASRDASKLPLAKNARYTENGQAMGFNNGMWQTASKVGAYRHVLADPATGQFGLFATMDENGHGLTLGARVRLHLGQISEVELVTYRTGAGPAWNDAGYGNLEKMQKPKALWSEVPPTGKRLSRQELIAAANNYFNAIENNDGKGYYPFTDDCDRLENGTLTSNNPGIVRMGGIDIGGMGCKEQFSTGLYGVVTEVHDRRFPIVDEERQAVFAFAVFDHCGCKKELVMPDGRKVDIGMFNKPSSILLAEAFKLKEGMIQQVEAVGTSVPYHSDPGWSH
ncbi:hypothetical protein [Altererythrobacter fulvus]|uniref:hypothetical protein n=1 Tax=Caenibius fulvus TaxID=2126012 RepID=UPI003019D909